MNWLLDLKDEYPFLFFLSCITLAISIVLSVTFLAPTTEITRAMGLVSLQTKATATRHALYWSWRARTNVSSNILNEKTDSRYGLIKGLAKDGNLLFLLPDGKNYVQHNAKLADIVIDNPILANEFIASQYPETSARFDYYGNGNFVVVKTKDNFLNLKLVETGYAKPDPNPPTNIVDKLFSTYYWNIANEVQNEKN